MDAHRRRRAALRAPRAHRPRRRHRVRREPRRGPPGPRRGARPRANAPVVVQIDEPTLPAVLAGSLRTPSGYGTVGAVPGARPAPCWPTRSPRPGGGRGAGGRALLPPHAAVWRCSARSAPTPWPSTWGRSVARTPRRTCLDALGELWEAGTELWLGIVPSTDPDAPPALHDLATPALGLADRLGFDRARLADRAVITPACGLAGRARGGPGRRRARPSSSPARSSTHPRAGDPRAVIH